MEELNMNTMETVAEESAPVVEKVVAAVSAADKVKWMSIGSIITIAGIAVADGVRKHMAKKKAVEEDPEDVVDGECVEVDTESEEK